MPLQLPEFMVTPPCMELKPSLVVTNRSGVFCKEPISIDSKFGPFVGEIITKDELDKKEKDIDFRYAWHVLDSNTNQTLHVVNATEPEKGNWMRYVNSARFYEEQNIVSVQEGNEIFYQALKDIKPGEELLTWFETTNRKSRKRKQESRSISVLTTERKGSTETNPPQGDLVGNGKRLRKKKVSEDMVPLDHDDVIFASSGHHHNRIKHNASSGNTRRRCASVPAGKVTSSAKVGTQKNGAPAAVPKSVASVQPMSKMQTSTSHNTVSTSQQTNATGSGDLLRMSSGVQFSEPRQTPPMKRPKTILQIVDFLKSSKEQSNGSHDTKDRASPQSGTNDKPLVGFMGPSRPKQKRSSLVGTAEYMEEHMNTNFQFLFRVIASHKTVPCTAPKRKRYTCDICENLYRKALSLKRHVLREHLNQKYLSEEDIAVLDHKKAMSTARIEADVDPDADDMDASDSSSDGNSPRVRPDGSEQDESLLLKEEMVENETHAAATVDGANSSLDVNSVALEGSGKEAKAKLNRAAIEESLMSKPIEGRKTFSYGGIDGVTDAFRCHLCVQLFPSVVKLKHHLTHDAHRSKGDKQFGCERCNQRFRFRHNYQRHMESHGSQISELSTACHICGKKFLNEANMRKHLRFHSGRNFPCKYGCDVVYPNVAELVKHLRAVHPDLPKRSQAPLPDMGNKTSTEPQKGKDMTASNNSVRPVVEPVQFKTEEEAIMEFKALHPAGWTETRGRKPPKDVTGDICPICKKKFSTYGSMCRHRRSVHRVVKMSGQFVKMLPAPPSTAPLKAEEESPAWEDSANSRSVHIEARVEKIYEDLEKEQAERESSDFGFDFSPPPSPASYYRNVADNIADNLSNYVDGGSEALKSAHQHIIVDGYVPLDEAEGIQVDHANFQWSTYNFPRFFSPTDPVIPLPPPPPAGPSSDQKGTFLSLEGDISLAYPTRSAVAEREATRRGSVGTSDGLNLGEKERMPRRASFGSLGKQNRDECKLVRRASVGSFENQQGTGIPVGRVSAKVVERRSQNDSSDSDHQKGNEKSEKTGQSDEVFDSPVHVNSVNSKNSLFAQSSGSEDLLQLGTSEANEDEEEKKEGVMSSKTVDQNQTKDEESSTSVTDSSTCQTVCQSKKVVNPQGSVVSPSREPACAISEECDDLIVKTDGAIVPPGSIVENSNVASSDSNALIKGLAKDLADDMSQCAESRRCQPSSNTVGDTLVVESTASGTMETREGGAEKIGEAWSLSVKGINDAPVNGHKNNVCEKPAVTVKEQPDKNTDQNSGQLDTSKDSASKSEHLPPTMISKAADNTASTCAEAQPSNDLSEKELECLSKGIILYVRKDKKPCPHVTDTATVPARSVESKDEEEYLKKLQLAAKKVKVPTTVTSADTTYDKKISASENGDAPKPTAGSRQASGEGGQDQNEACKENNDSFPVNSPDLKARTDDSTDQKRKAPEEMGKTSEKKDQQSSSSSDLLLSQPVMADDDDSQSQSDALMSQPADGEQDSSVDCELFDLQTKFRLQALQERVAIDREAEEICRHCQPDNTEFGEPSKRTAEDFANMRFGRKSTVFFVCSLCRRYFYGVESLLRHQVKKHPSIQCSYFEVENGHGLEMLFYPEPSSRGVLAESVLLPPQYINQESYTCTRCNLTFKQYSRLRAHILNCDPNTPTTPHTRKKRPKANRHRFMEKMLPDTSPSSSTGSKVGKASEQSGAVRNLSFRPKSQGTVMGLRAKSFPSTSRNYRLLHQGSTKKDDAKSSSSAPIGRLPSTRVKTQNWKYSPPRFSTTSSKLSISPVKAGRPQRRRNHEMRYNPAAHVRRREKTECVDIHQCQGCRLSFRTLSLLERHTKNCSGREKLLSQTPVANKLLDGQEDKKHCCHYCPKRFKYLKGVYNHYINFCRVRSERISREGLSQEDQAHEEQLQASLQQQAWNKMENRDHTDVIQGRACLHDDGTITHTRHKGGWPRGQKRSNKRRRNGWTYIKRRKPDGNTSESSSSPSKSRSASSLASSVRSSGSATSAAMSELEARLREPIGAETKRKRSAKELEQHSECHSAQESKGADNLQPASQPEGSTSKAKKSKLDDDLSQAPVIDRMDTDPPVQPREGKQMSPDLEPPILSPIPPVVPQDSLQTKKRKPKRKAVEPTAQKDANQTTKSLNPVPSAIQDKPPVVLSPLKKEKNGEETTSVAASSAVVAAQVNLGEGKTGSVYVLEHLVDAARKNAAQYTLVHLKVPTVVSKETGQAEPHHSAGRDSVVMSNSSLKSAGVSSVNVGTMVPKSLPPNFLFPPPEGSSDQNTKPHREEDSKVGHRSTTSEPDKKAVAGKSQDTPELATAKRKSRQTKKKVQDLPATVSIKTMFKKKKSPTRTKYTDTLKNMEAYHFEKETVTCGASSLPASVKVTTTRVNNTAIVNTTATLSSPLTSTAASVNTSVTSSTSPISSCVPSLPPGSGLAMLPPGAFLAVLPNPPILLQSPTGSSLTSQPTSPVRSTPATVTLPLQTAVSEGKVLFLDKSGLSSLLAPSSHPVATSTLSVASSGKGGAKGGEQSQTKISVAQFKTLLAIKNSRMSQQSKKELDEKNDMTVKAAVDVPNFLYDTTKSAEPSSTVQVSPSQDCSSNQKDEKESLPKKTPGKAKGKGKKPKRGPPPSSNSPYCGSKVKSMTMMTSPGNHTLVSLSVPSSSATTVEGTGDPQRAAGKGSNAVADSSAETSCNTSPKRTWLSLSSIQPNLSEQGEPAKEGSVQSTAGDSVKKATRAAKRKQPASTGEGEEKSAEKAEVVISPVTRADKVCDAKTVVLNVPVLEKRGGKRNTAVTRNAARKSVDAPSCNVRGKRTSASTSSAAEKSSPGPTARGSSAPSSEVPVKARGKISAASAGQVRGKPNSASASEVTSDDDMPLSAVAAKIKDQ